MSAAVPKANRLSSSNASVEAALYPLVKAFLERQGYVVRGEVRGCDLVARRGDEAPVIVELKMRFTLPLLLQGIDRLALSPLVYLAVPSVGSRFERPVDGAARPKRFAPLKIYHRDSPASMSILEEATNSTEIPMMGVFNNLVLYKQDVAQNSLQSIVPDLATDWSWNEDGTELTFRLRQGVKWHDGHPFTANDVNCTWDLLLGKSQEKLRANPRKAWYQNVETVTADADLTATFHLQTATAGDHRAARLGLCAGLSLPCVTARHAPASDRHRPVQIRRVQAERIYQGGAQSRLLEERDRPYLDGIEYTVIPNRSTAILSFIAGKFDMTFPFEVTVPLLRDVKSQAPQAICELVPANASANLITNRDAPPFDNPEMRRALALSLGPQGVHRHPHRGAWRHRRGHAAAAGRGVGHAAGHAQELARL